MRTPDLSGAGWAALACPVCGADLLPAAEYTLGCGRGHRFDLARQGYVALLGGRSRLDTGDSAVMVQAREEFLGRGHYAPIAAAVADLVPAAGSPILDIGAGTGYYLTAVLDTQSAGAGIAMDASKFAARRAAADARITSVLADAWSAWPVRDHSVGAVLTVFAPRNPAETRRVLRPGGVLVVVVPDPDHQRELREPLGLLSVDEGKPERLAETFGRPHARAAVRQVQQWSTTDITTAVGMGPTARHLAADTLARRVDELDPPVAVTVSVTVSAFIL